MAPRQENTRDKILDRARALLHCCGLEGFSYRDIATPLGIRNAAVHYHFPSKHDLTLALVETFAAELREQMRTARERRIPPRDQLEVYFSHHCAEVEAGATICVFGASAPSYERQTPEVQAALRRVSELVNEWLVGILEAGRREGSFRFQGSAQGKAAQIGAAILGARQLCAMGWDSAVTVVLEQCRQELYVDAPASVYALGSGTTIQP